MTVIINGSSGITNVNGTAAAPAETGTDTDSGIVYGTNTVSLATNGTTAVTVDASQNVGIGTTSPAQKLHVSSSGTSAGVIQLGGAGTTGYYSQVNQSGNNLQLIANGDQEYRVSLGTNNGSGFITFLTATGTTGNTERMRIDSSGNVLIGTTTAQTGAVLAVTGGIQGTIKSGTAVASTSGTSIDFTSIPSWVKRITVMLSGVSTNGTSQKMFQLGTGSTTFATSGYATSTTFWAAGSLGTAQYTNAFQLYNLVTAADVLSGHIVFTNITGNTWVGSGLIGNTGGSLNTMVIGNIALGATLTGVRMTTANGTDTFDAGSINILYEG